MIKQKCNTKEDLTKTQEKKISEINSKLTSFIELQNQVNKQVFEDVFVYKLIIIATSISVSTGLLFSTGFWLASL